MHIFVSILLYPFHNSMHATVHTITNISLLLYSVFLHRTSFSNIHPIHQFMHKNKPHSHDQGFLFCIEGIVPSKLHTQDFPSPQSIVYSVPDAAPLSLRMHEIDNQLRTFVLASWDFIG